MGNNVSLTIKLLRGGSHYAKLSSGVIFPNFWSPFFSVFLGTLHTIWHIFLHQRCWTTTNRSSPPSEYCQIVRSSICLTFIGFRRCTKIHINTDSLRVYQSVPPSLYPFYLQNCLHTLSKVFRSTARQPTQEVGSIRCGSSRIQTND